MTTPKKSLAWLDNPLLKPLVLPLAVAMPVVAFAFDTFVEPVLTQLALAADIWPWLDRFVPEKKKDSA